MTIRGRILRGRILGGVKHVGRNSDRFGKGERGR